MLGTRIDGTVVVIECAFSINLTALTLEQVLNKRHKLVKDTASGMALETRAQMGDKSAQRLHSTLETRVLTHAPEYFNNDANFSKAMLTAINLKGETLNGHFKDAYGSLEMVFGQQSFFSLRLDALIGPPITNLRMGMFEEHCSW